MFLQLRKLVHRAFGSLDGGRCAQVLARQVVRRRRAGQLDEHRRSYLKGVLETCHPVWASSCKVSKKQLKHLTSAGHIPIVEESFPYRYTTAMHWSLTQQLGLQEV